MDASTLFIFPPLPEGKKQVNILTHTSVTTLPSLTILVISTPTQVQTPLLNSKLPFGATEMFVSWAENLAGGFLAIYQPTCSYSIYTPRILRISTRNMIYFVVNPAFGLLWATWHSLKTGANQWGTFQCFGVYSFPIFGLVLSIVEPKLNLTLSTRSLIFGNEHCNCDKVERLISWVRLTSPHLWCSSSFLPFPRE